MPEEPERRRGELREDPLLQDIDPATIADAQALHGFLDRSDDCLGNARGQGPPCYGRAPAVACRLPPRRYRSQPRDRPAVLRERVDGELHLADHQPLLLYIV